jgi:hypothetical protein
MIYILLLLITSFILLVSVKNIVGIILSFVYIICISLAMILSYIFSRSHIYYVMISSILLLFTICIIGSI